MTPTDTRMTKERVEAFVRDLTGHMPEGTTISLGDPGHQDGIMFQAVKVFAGDGNGADPVVVTGVRRVVNAFRDAGGSTVTTRVPGGQEIKVLLDII